MNGASEWDETKPGENKSAVKLLKFIEYDI